MLKSTSEAESYNQLVSQHYRDTIEKCCAKLSPALFDINETHTVLYKPKTILIIPGAFAKEFPEHGADGRRIVEAAKRLGIAAHVVNLPSFCSPEVGAEGIAKWFETTGLSNVVLFSLSKGSLDLIYFIKNFKNSRYFHSIDAVVSVNGIINGTPLVNRIDRSIVRKIGVKALLRYHGYRYRDLKPMIWSQEYSDRFSAVQSLFPILFLQSFPYLENLSNSLAKKSVRRLSLYGPSDGGGVLLSDISKYRGVVLPILRQDHYLTNFSEDLLLNKTLHLLYVLRSSPQIKFS